MFPCVTDLAFYSSKTRPAWAQRLEPRENSSIDSVINAHAGQRNTSGELAAHNLLAILRM